MANEPVKVIVDCLAKTTKVVPLSASEIAERDALAAQAAQEYADKVAAEESLAALKASAKAKLVAGEPLTAEEANTLVI